MEAYTDFANVYDTFMENNINEYKKPVNVVFMGFLLSCYIAFVYLRYPCFTGVYLRTVVKNVVYIVQLEGSFVGVRIRKYS